MVATVVAAPRRPGGDDRGGLTFALSAGGLAVWIFRYSFGGRHGELTIGRYPDIGLAEARGIATLKRAEVQQGRNPAAEKQTSVDGSGDRRGGVVDGEGVSAAALKRPASSAFSEVVQK
jgi:hypothetical protein